MTDFRRADAPLNENQDAAAVGTHAALQKKEPSARPHWQLDLCDTTLAGLLEGATALAQGATHDLLLRRGGR
jgi:hypothetical protein